MRKVDMRRLEEACRIERMLLARGLTLDDINYYAMAGHEAEAEEAYGVEVAEAIIEWREAMKDFEETSACRLLEKLRERSIEARTLG